MNKPFNPAAERNKAPILATIERYLLGSRDVLEIGAGSGQHAVYLAAQLPHLRWQPSEQADHLAGLRATLADVRLANLLPALELNVLHEPWPVVTLDAVFAANVVQCMSSPALEALFRGVGRRLAAQGVFLLYGPFNRDGRFTSEGNQQLDAWARSLHADFGLRDREHLEQLAARHGLRLCEDHVMPANNQLLVWRAVANRTVNEDSQAPST
jgi:cyclopropane fatty-acyl-phospholipid synthase-like methyltransferase